MCQTNIKSVLGSIEFCCDNSAVGVVETASIDVVIAFRSRATFRIIESLNSDFKRRNAPPQPVLGSTGSGAWIPAVL